MISNLREDKFIFKYLVTLTQSYLTSVLCDSKSYDNLSC
jgi:hypothetical protein